jgi:hypothetical protein
MEYNIWSRKSVINHSKNQSMYECYNKFSMKVDFNLNCLYFSGFIFIQKYCYFKYILN